MASKDQPHPRFDLNSLKLNSELTQSRSAHKDCRNNLAAFEKENFELKCRLSELRRHNDVVLKLVGMLSDVYQLLEECDCDDDDGEDEPDESLAIHG